MIIVKTIDCRCIILKKTSLDTSRNVKKDEKSIPIIDSYTRKETWVLPILFTCLLNIPNLSTCTLIYLNDFIRWWVCTAKIEQRINCYLNTS